MDFIADDTAVFEEIANLFWNDDVQIAKDRFARMPKRARQEIYGQLQGILNASGKVFNAEDVFYGRNAEEQKAIAIEAYLLKKDLKEKKDEQQH